MTTNPTNDPVLDDGTRQADPRSEQNGAGRARPTFGARLERALFRMIMLVIVLGAAFAAGFFVMEQQSQPERERLRQEQAAAQERIAALELQIAELQRSRESANSVELDLTEVFDPIRAAVSRVALVKMDEIARQITADLAQVVEAHVREAAAGQSPGEAPTLADGARPGLTRGAGGPAVKPLPAAGPPPPTERLKPTSAVADEVGTNGEVAGKPAAPVAKPAAPANPPTPLVDRSKAAEPVKAPENGAAAGTDRTGTTSAPGSGPRPAAPGQPVSELRTGPDRQPPAVGASDGASPATARAGNAVQAAKVPAPSREDADKPIAGGEQAGNDREAPPSSAGPVTGPGGTPQAGPTTPRPRDSQQ